MKVSRGAILHIRVDIESPNFNEEFREALEILDEWHKENWSSPPQFFGRGNGYTSEIDSPQGPLYGDDLEFEEK